MNDKKKDGFSLIELIIAIAILVILTGLLAPQFMKYVEQAKRAKIIRAMDSFYESIQVAYIEALEESEDRSIGDNAFIIQGKPGFESDNSFDKILCQNAKEIIGEDIKYTNIIIQFDKSGMNGNEPIIESYYISGISISYFPQGLSFTDYYYFVDGTMSNSARPGNYGECKNGQFIKWK